MFETTSQLQTKGYCMTTLYTFKKTWIITLHINSLQMLIRRKKTFVFLQNISPHFSGHSLPPSSHTDAHSTLHTVVCVCIEAAPLARVCECESSPWETGPRSATCCAGWACYDRVSFNSDLIRDAPAAARTSEWLTDVMGWGCGGSVGHNHSH